MEVLKTFRHEIKYIISYSEFLYLRKKLDDLLEIDRNQLGYMIRSMYFDSINDDDYYEKLSGEVNRKKIRLRIYDKEGELVKLEIKQKYDLLKDAIVNKNYELAAQEINKITNLVNTRNLKCKLNK